MTKRIVKSRVIAEMKALLAKVRAENHWTWEDLAAVTGVPHSTARKIGDTNYSLSIATLERMVERVGYRLVMTLEPTDERTRVDARVHEASTSRGITNRRARGWERTGRVRRSSRGTWESRGRTQDATGGGQR